jgi:hypothetical protein
MAGRVAPTCVEAPPLVSTAPTEKRKCGAKASQKTGTWRASRSAGVTGRERKFTKVVADSVLLEVETGASNELPLALRQSFKDGRCHTPVLKSRTEASIRKPRMFKSHV